MRKLKLFSLLAVLLCSATMWADVAVDGKLPGAFSVSTDKQVHFSQGNLQYNSDTQKWQFAENQYDYVGNDDEVGNEKVTTDGIANGNGIVDMFGWVGASSTWEDDLKQYGITTAESGYGNDASESLKSDWGTLMGTGWFTLSTEQWNYLFNGRTCAYRFAKARLLGSTFGIIIFPDDYTHPDGVAAVEMLNDEHFNNGNQYNAADWGKMEEAGAVFLPAAGFRDSGGGVSNCGQYGYYWSSSPYTSDANYAYVMNFNYQSMYPMYNGGFRNQGYSVRLVTEAAPAPTPDPTPSTAAVNGKLPGAFSVSADKQVYFSQGNLQARATDGDTWTWDFADNQWDYVGNSIANTKINGNGSVSEDGTVDLFGWSTAATYYGIHKNDYGDFYSGAFVDWGNISDIISSYGEGWKTLTKDEWVYLFNTRTNAEDKYATATVNGVSGLVILPDNWTLPEGCSFTAGTNFYFGENVYDATAWGKMEAAGAVFLPAAGYRSTGQIVNSVGDDGYYWSATIYNESQAYCVYFNGLVFLADSEDDRHFGNSVRLVTEAASTPDPTPTTPETSDNVDGIETAMAALIGAGTTDLIINRTLYKDGCFNTLCLPFSLNAEELAASPLAGCQLYSLSDADYDGENLNLTIAEETAIVAGKPYLIKWNYGSNITSMTFTDVTVTASTGSTVTKGTGTHQVKFVGTIGRSTLPADNTNYLFVAANDNLKYSQAGDATSMKGFRAYFIVDSETSTDIPHQVPARLVIAPKMPTGIDNVQGDNVQSTKVIENGQLYIMYNGTRYNVQGKVVK